MLRHWAHWLLFLAKSILAIAVIGSLQAGSLRAADAPAAAQGGTEKPSAEAAIRQALAKKVSLWYHEVPLKNVVDDLEQKLGVPVRLDTAALKDAGVDEETPVTFKLPNVSAQAAISLMLRKWKLTAIIAHETLLITSCSAAESMLVTKVYDVSDFAGDDENEIGPVIDTITNCVQPKAWSENGGEGSIHSFASPGICAMVVSQSQNVLSQIDDLLEQLRSVRHAKTAGQSAARNPATTAQDAAAPQLPARESQLLPRIPAVEKAIRQSLEKRLTVDFKEMPLADAIQVLAKAASVSIALDDREIVNPTVAVTLHASGRTLRSILDELVRPIHDELVSPIQLAWTYRDESLLITTASEAESDSMLSTRVYSLEDFPAYQDQRGEAVPDFKNTIETITGSVRPKSWQEAGGMGTIGKFEKSGIHGIVVSETWQAHLEIESILIRLRDLRGRALTADDIKKLPPVPADEPEAPRTESPDMEQPFGPVDRKPLGPDPRRDSIVAANNQFAIDLHKKLGGDNRFFSPSSAATAMAMVYAGAKGKTAEEIAGALHFTLPQEEVAPAFQSLLATLPAANHTGCTLTAANRLWGQKGYGFLVPYLTTTRERFGGELAALDFANRAAACETINAWADEKTAGKIKQVISPDAISPRLRLILTNAVYFKGQWAARFKASATRTAPFFSGDERIDVAMMHQTAECRYGAFDDVKVLEKSYRGGEIAMTILLPEKGPQALADLEQTLSAEKVKEWTSRLKLHTVDVHLPKFRLETSIPLTSALTSLGMARVFDARRADLTGINGGKEPLWLDWILQRAFVDVEEEGTEAAAVTGGGMFGGAAPPRIVVFRADHPFVFLIRDTRTGYILFMGRLVKPGR
jgi:serpin B